MPEYRFHFSTDHGGRYSAVGCDDTEASAKVQDAFGIHPFDLILDRTVPVPPLVARCGSVDSHGGHVVPNGERLAFCAGNRFVLTASEPPEWLRRRAAGELPAKDYSERMPR